MKRHLLIIIICFILVLVSAPVSAKTRYGHNYFEYYVEDGGIQICGYLGNETEVTVPNMISGLPVYAIVEGAFADCDSVQKLNLPDTIMEIEEGAISSSIEVSFMGNFYGNSGETENTEDQTADLEIDDLIDTENEAGSSGAQQNTGNSGSAANEIRPDGSEETGSESTASEQSNVSPEEPKSEDREKSDTKKAEGKTPAEEKTPQENETVPEEDGPVVTYGEEKESRSIKSIIIPVAIIMLCAMIGIVVFILRNRKTDQ